MRRILFLLLVLSFAIGVTGAKEVIHFHNGTTMEVVGHKLENGMVRVELDEKSEIAFPRYMVETITRSGKAITLEQTTKRDRPKRQMAPDTALKQKVRHGYQAEQAAQDNIDLSKVGLEVDAKTGLAVYKPFAKGSSQGKSRLGVTGNTRLYNAPAARGDSRRGTVRRGRGETIGPVTHPRLSRGGDSPVIGLEANPSATEFSRDSRPKPGDPKPKRKP